MEILGYVLAIVIGLVLGLMGGGGATLAVPVLVYIFGYNYEMATGYSLFIVGLASLIGAVSYMRKKLVDFRSAFLFGVPSIITVFFTRSLFLPYLPDTFFTMGSFAFTKEVFIMVLFSTMLILSAISMIIPNKENEISQKEVGPWIVLVEGVLVGLLTGLVGAGGGFIIIPALILFSKLDMKTAVGTSLLIISVKSLAGFTGEVLAQPNIDWSFLLSFTGVAIIGIFIGSFLSKYIPGKTLKPAFGIFILLMGIYIIGKEIYSGVLAS